MYLKCHNLQQKIHKRTTPAKSQTNNNLNNIITHIKQENTIPQNNNFTFIAFLLYLFSLLL